MFERDIEASPQKIIAISNMGPIRNIKATQSWFISRLGERGMPLYKLLKKTDAFI